MKALVTGATAFAVVTLFVSAANADVKKPFTPVVINGESYIDVDISKVASGRTAKAIDIDGEWLTFTTRKGTLPYHGNEAPANPELFSSLKIVQIFYISGGASKLSEMKGDHFTACRVPAAPAPGSQAAAPDPQEGDSDKYPTYDDPKNPPKDSPKLSRNYVGFAFDPKDKESAECVIAVWKVRLKAGDSLQNRGANLQELLTHAGDRLAYDLQNIRDIAQDMSYSINYTKDSVLERQRQQSQDPKAKKIKQAPYKEASICQSLHDSAQAALLVLGVNAKERPKDAHGIGGWLKYTFTDYLAGRSSSVQVPVNDPAVVDKVTAVYLQANFLIADLEPYKAQGKVGDAIDHLQKFSDEIAKSLGLRRDGPGTSRLYYAIMDNAAWVFSQMTDHLYLGLSDDEMSFMRQTKVYSEKLRKIAREQGDTVVVDFVNTDFRNSWNEGLFQGAVEKLSRNQTELAGDILQILETLRAELEAIPGGGGKGSFRLPQ